MRKKIVLIFIALALLFALSSCRNHIEIDYTAEIDGTWGSLFEVFWNNMNKNYIMFSQDYSGDGWDRVYETYSPRFNALGAIDDAGSDSLGNREGARMIFDIGKELSDGHFSMDVMDGNGDLLFYFSAFYYKIYKEANVSDDEIFSVFYGDAFPNWTTPIFETTPTIAINTFDMVTYVQSDGTPADGSTGENTQIIPASGHFNGTLDNGSTFVADNLFLSDSGNDILLAEIDGEILYFSFFEFVFTGNSNAEVLELLDNYVSKLNDEKIKGIIIDLRGNVGGYNNDLIELWGPMIDTNLPYCQVRIKDGVNRNNFSPWVEEELMATGDKVINKPIAVIFNRASISCPELSVMIFQAIRDKYGIPVRSFGSGNTAGGMCSSSQYDDNGYVRPMFNAGTFQSKPYLDLVSTPNMQRRALDGKIYEDVGLAPDELIPFNQEYFFEFESGNDQLLFKAIDWVKGQM